MTHTEQERAEFEAMIKANADAFVCTDPHWSDVMGRYVKTEHNAAWVIFQAARRAQVVPDGWKLVPVMPTNAMESAGGDAINDPDLSTSLCECAAVTWAAMLAAAPQPPEIQPKVCIPETQTIGCKTAAAVQCKCGDKYLANSYGAGFLDALGKCPNCDAESQAAPRYTVNLYAPETIQKTLGGGTDAE